MTREVEVWECGLCGKAHQTEGEVMACCPPTAEPVMNRAQRRSKEGRYVERLCPHCGAKMGKAPPT